MISLGIQEKDILIKTLSKEWNSVKKLLKEYLLHSPLDALLPFQQSTHLKQRAKKIKKNNE